MSYQGDTYFIGGSAVRIGKRIGKGGEGEVFLIESEPGRALKIYTGHNAKEREAKISAMVRAGLASSTSSVAFPRSVALTKDGHFVGFAMELVIPTPAESDSRWGFPKP